jgi:penicillin-binding protein 2
MKTMFRIKNSKKSKNVSRGTEIEDYLLTATEKEAARMESPLEKNQLRFFWWFVVLLLMILGGRIIHLNVIKGNYYKEIAKGNRIRSIVIKAPRGKIMDRSGDILVNNVPSVDMVIIPADLPEEGGRIREMATELAEILKLNDGEIQAKLESVGHSSLDPILLKENVTQEESLIFMERKKDFPGIMMDRTAVREYVDGLIFSHILGYEGKIGKKELEENPGYLFTDYIGKQGVEKSYENYLRGVHGALQVEVDSMGTVKKELGVINPKAGSDLVLSVNAELQKKIFDELGSVLEKTQTKTAAAIAINPKNGEIMALVSLPSFDNNLFSHSVSGDEYSKLINDPGKPLFNRVISGEYPPGSTLKPLIATAALSEGTINEGTSVSCSGAINIGSYRFGDWKAHGATNVRKAIAESCDVFFYSVGGGYGGVPGLGMSRMKKYENLFGLGKKTGIDLPGESNGLIPDEQWKFDRFSEKWYTGDSYHAAIGQGYVTLTPLQLVNYIAAVANGKALYKPHLVSQIRKNDGQTIDIKPEILEKNLVSPDILKVVQEGMRETITSGTAQSLNNLPVEVAGKTGTAQFGSENKTHAWFVSYAPYDDPEIAMAILVEGGGEGHSSAVPVTKEVYKWYFGDRNP